MSKLQQARLAKGLTREELSKLSGVSTRTIDKYENGEINILKAAVGNMVAIADVLETNVKDLI